MSILFLSSSPDDTTRVRFDREIEGIQARLRYNGHRLRHASAMAVCADRLSDHLLTHRPSIVHFIGHGTEDGCLTFEGENGQAHHVQADILSRLFHCVRGRMRFLFLNACQTAPLVEQTARHIDCVLGMRRTIPDEASRAFAESFYAKLAHEQSVRGAFEIACLELEMKWPGLHEIPVLEEREGCDARSLWLRFNENGEPCIVSEDVPGRALSGKRLRFELIVEGNMEQFPEEVSEKFTEILRLVSRDPRLTLHAVKKGSVKFDLEGDEEAVKHLVELQERGELSKVLGMTVKGVVVSEEPPPTTATAAHAFAEVAAERVRFMGMVAGGRGAAQGRESERLQTHDVPAATDSAIVEGAVPVDDRPVLAEEILPMAADPAAIREPQSRLPAEGSVQIERRGRRFRNVLAEGSAPIESRGRQSRNVLAEGSAPVARILIQEEKMSPEDLQAEDTTAITMEPAVITKPTEDAVRLDDLVRRIRPRLLALALRLTRGNRAEAEDLAQESLARGVKNFPPRGKGGSYEAWFITILRNLFLDECKRRKNRPVTASLDNSKDVPAPVPEEIPVWARVTREQLERSIAALPEKYRRPFALNARRYSYREIAAELDISATTVATRLREARSRLKELLLKEVDRD